MLVVAVLLFIFATFDGKPVVFQSKYSGKPLHNGSVAFGLEHDLQAFVFYKDGLAPAEFYNDLTTATEAISNVATILTVLIWDAALVSLLDINSRLANNF